MLLMLCADAITWVCPGTEQEAATLPVLKNLAAQVSLCLSVDVVG